MTADLPSPPGDLPAPSGNAPEIGDNASSAPLETPPPEVFGRHADPGLEATLPKNVDGVPLTVFSLTASEFLTDANADAYHLLLQRLQRTESDITLALAVDPSRQLGSMSALRVTGVGADDLLLAVRDITAQSAAPAPTTAMASMAGRDVLVVTPDSGGSDASQFIFTIDDVVFAIRDVDADLAERFIMAMP